MLTRGALLVLCVAILGQPASAGSAAGIKSNAPGVRLFATVQEQLGLSLATPWIGLLRTPGELTTTEQPVEFSTRWNLRASRAKVTVRAYFEDAFGTAVRLKSTDTRGAISTMSLVGTPMPGSGSSELGEHGMELFRQRFVAGKNLHAARTDAIDLRLDLKSLKDAKANDYEGTLTLVVEAY